MPTSSVGPRKLLGPLVLIFLLIGALQIAAAGLQGYLGSLRQAAAERQGVAANQRRLVDEYERTSYLAVVGLATDNWSLLLDQRSRASALATQFNAANEALLRGGQTTLAGQAVSLQPVQGEQLTELGQEADRLWKEATAAQVRMLRSGNNDLKDNQDLDQFRQHTGALGGLLGQLEQAILAQNGAAMGQVELAQKVGPALGVGLLVLLAGYVYRQILRPLVHTTARLDERNRGMKLVFDNVDQGLVTIDLFGEMVGERSAVLDAWLGIPAGSDLVAHLERAAPTTAQWLRLGLESIRDGMLPIELLLQQLPSRMEVAGRTLEIEYQPIQDDGVVGRLLVVMRDISAKVAQQRLDEQQRDILSLFHRIISDRPGYESFLHESRLILERLETQSADPVLAKRLIHTLKGNCGLFGLSTVARVCHEVEDELQNGERDVTAQDVARIRAVWTDLTDKTSIFLQAPMRPLIEVDQGEYLDLLESIRRGISSEVLLERLRTWQLEPVERSFVRLGEHARRLSVQRGRPEVSVQIDANRVRLDADDFGSFWLAMVHAVRNAIDHGIESPEERLAKGKPQAGTLRFEAEVLGGELVVRLRDDGRGVDWASIAKKAAQLGLPHETRADLEAAMWADGVSTREQATELSGRGVGTSALAQETKNLGGHVVTTSSKDEGTDLEFHFPLDRAQGPVRSASAA